MASIIRLKQEIQFNTRLGSLLDVLKSIAAQQFQILERSMRTNPVFLEALQGIVYTFDLDSVAHPFTQDRGSCGVIAVTSNSGLLGGLNQQVVNVAMREYRKQPGELIIIGERGLSYVKEQGLAFHAFPGVEDDQRETLAAQIRSYALSQVLQQRLGSLTIVHPHALSFTHQQVEVKPVLPCQRWAQAASIPQGVRGGTIIMESALPDIIEYAVWLWLGVTLYEVFGLSRLAELAARAVHLEGSSQELQSRGQTLKRKYFRLRHEAIDANMRELFAARSLFGHS